MSRAPLLNRIPVLRTVRPFPEPVQWTVVTGMLSPSPWVLPESVLRQAFGPIWNGPQWYAVHRAGGTLLLEADGYFSWCRTNRWLAQDAGEWPADARSWLQHYVWTNPPGVPDGWARIALTTGGWIRDRHGRYLAVQSPGRSDWTGSAGGGITPEDGWGPEAPARSWRREVREELGIDLQDVRLLGVVADARTDCWSWLFAGVWEGDWATEPWRRAEDGPLEVLRATWLDREAQPPTLSPAAAWAWNHLP